MTPFLEKHRNKWEAITETGCFIWTAASDTFGYGSCWCPVECKTKKAHVLSLAETEGPPPPGTEASHLCHVRCCVNPAHLRWETTSENCLRKPKALREKSADAAGKSRRANARGCHFRVRSGKWIAQATLAGKRTHIGCFSTEAEAVAAYNLASGRVE